MAEALAGVAERPRWVLLDLMLPDGCGIDVLRRARADGLASRVCVITGCGPALVDQAVALGAERVFTKPLDVERLIAALSPEE